MNVETMALKVILDNKYRIAPRLFEECNTLSDVETVLREKLGANDDPDDSEPAGPVNLREYRDRIKRRKRKK